ncbi:MAG: hypothetical protein COT43_02690 [Candidatus Marinimicrobia bacterium CG08_land_8_20_14_0_20_45_22]|nr:MAG: hypothetical protein COT43_02690 [Candidatus Marinimicrobia bacterium CG08_land_8_20_14_0_20_45_22]
MPLIEIDQEVWNFLQEKAKLLGVTSNDVLRIIFKIKPKHEITSEPPKVCRISQDDLIPYIIQFLKEKGGSAPKGYVEQKIFHLFIDMFEQTYYQQKVSHGVPRWQHNIAWAKERAKQMGLIDSPSVSGWGIWKLTEKGKTQK